MYCKEYVKYIKLCFSVLADGSADSDKMPPYAAFHLGLHCLNLYIELKGKWRESVVHSSIQQDFGKFNVQIISNVCNIYTFVHDGNLSK